MDGQNQLRPLSVGQVSAAHSVYGVPRVRSWSVDRRNDRSAPLLSVPDNFAYNITHAAHAAHATAHTNTSHHSTEIHASHATSHANISTSHHCGRALPAGEIPGYHRRGMCRVSAWKVFQRAWRSAMQGKRCGRAQRQQCRGAAETIRGRGEFRCSQNGRARCVTGMGTAPVEIPQPAVLASCAR